MEPSVPSSLERIATSSNKSPATIAAMVVAAYTFMAGAILWSFSGRYGEPVIPELRPSNSQELVQCDKEPRTTLAALSECHRRVERATR